MSIYNIGLDYVQDPAVATMFSRVARRAAKLSPEREIVDRAYVHERRVPVSPLPFTLSRRATLARLLLDSKKLLQYENEILDYYFSNPKDKKKILEGINLLWETEYLFKANPYLLDDYMQLLQKIVEQNNDLFCSVVNGYSNGRFGIEFKSLVDSEHLDELTKAICLTQALELALNGVLVTPVLKNINRHTLPVKVNGQEHPSGNGNGNGAALAPRERIKGHLQELLAGWFLTKFVYPEVMGSERQYQIQHCMRYKNKSAAEDERKRKEIDIRTPDALVEVKSYITANDRTNEFADLAVELYKFVLDANESFNLKGQIKRLIVISGSESDRDWALRSQDLDRLEKEATERIIKLRRNNTSANDGYRKEFSKGNNRVEFYHIGSAQNNYSIRKWIRFMHESKAKLKDQEAVAV